MLEALKSCGFHPGWWIAIFGLYIATLLLETWLGVNNKTKSSSILHFIWLLVITLGTLVLIKLKPPGGNDDGN